MTAHEFNISDLTPEQVVALAAAGYIKVNGSTAPQSSQPAPKQESKRSSKPRALPSSELGVYGTRIQDKAEFDNLHPIIRRGVRGLAGSAELKAKLNMLVITGKCKLSPAAYNALGKVMYKNGLLSKLVRRDGKVVSRFYTYNTTKDGKPWGQASQFFLDGGRVRIDHSTKEAELVLNNGQSFAPEVVGAIGDVVDSLS